MNEEAKIRELLHDLVPGGVDGDLWEQVDQATASLLKLLTESRIDELEWVIERMESNDLFAPHTQAEIDDRLAELKGEKS